jgi:tetratricopeptide (TPR) repeat protein
MPSTVQNTRLKSLFIAVAAWGSLYCPSLAQDKPAVTTTSPAAAAVPQTNFSEPLVARVEMKLTLNDKIVDTIEKGDLLTVTGERGDSYVIQTFSGQKGSVAKINVARLAESVGVYDELIEAKPKEGRLYTLRAGAHWAIADNEKALSDFNKAIELGYQAAHAYSSRGLFQAAMGDYDAAIADYTTAIEKDPKDEVPLVNRASVYMSMGKYEEAAQDYTTAISINDNSAVYFQQRAIAQKLLGNTDQAVADYDRAIKMEPANVAAWMGRGFIKFQTGKPQEAIDDFTQVIELEPGTAVAFNNRGFNYQLLKQYDKADKDFKEALKLAPKYVLALQNRGWLLTTCEDEKYRDAPAAVEIAKTVCEMSEYKDVSDLTLLAAAHALKKEFAEAIGWQEKIIEYAAEPQKGVAKKILELYQQNKPLDPKLLEADEAAGAAAAGPSSPDAKPDTKNSPKSNAAPKT